jgi:hypothetical protein
MSRNVIFVLIYHSHKFFDIMVYKLPNSISLVPFISHNFFIALSHVVPDRLMFS